MATLGRAVLETGVDESGLRAGLTKAEGTTQTTFARMANVAKNVLAAGIAVATTAVFALASASATAVGMGSDLNETINKTGVIFGSATAEIVDFSAGADAALGQTQQGALDAATTFGVFGKSAGLAGEDLGDFAIELTSLASDMASFHNTSPEEAVLALGAALRGESEPIRRYGVLLDDATLRQKAMEMGIISTTKNALTPQQRVLAAYAAIMEQTSDAQGDFARTSDGLANQQRILRAELTNLATEWGSALLPVIEDFVVQYGPVLIDTLEVLTSTHLPAFVDWVARAAETIGKATEAAALLVTWNARIDEAVQSNENNIMRTSASYEEYVTRMVNAAVATGDLDASTAELMIQTVLMGEAQDAVSERILVTANNMGIMTEEELLAVQSGMALEVQDKKLITAWETGSQVMTTFNEDLEESKSSMAGAAGSAGILAGAVASVAQSYDAAKTAAQGVNEAMNQLSQTSIEQARMQAVMKLATEDLTTAQQEEILNQLSQLEVLERLNQDIAAGTAGKEEFYAVTLGGVDTMEEYNAMMGQTTDALSAEESQLVNTSVAMEDAHNKAQLMASGAQEMNDAVASLPDEDIVASMEDIGAGAETMATGFDEAYTVVTGVGQELLALDSGMTTTATGMGVLDQATVDMVDAMVEQEAVLGGFASGITAIGNAAAGAKSKVQSLADTVQELGEKTPGEYIPSSPPPFAQGLFWVADAASALKVELGTLSGEMQKLSEAFADGLLGNVESSLEEGATEIDRLVGLVEMASKASRVGGAFADIFETRTLDPLRGQIDALDTGLADQLAMMSEMAGMQFTSVEQLMGMAPYLAQMGLGSEASQLYNEIVSNYEQRVALAEELAKQEQRVLELQQKQQELNFLQAQMDLLKLAQEAGLDKSIFEGMLGLGADPAALTDLMDQVIQALIDQANESLETGSPSKVFTRIGDTIPGGLEQAMHAGVSRVANATRQLTRAAVDVADGTMSHLTPKNLTPGPSPKGGEGGGDMNFYFPNVRSGEPEVIKRAVREALREAGVQADVIRRTR